MFSFIGKIHYYENGSIIPLPARLCFECGKSCRKAPLIACDYCPLYFHQDCLDPPLTAFPSGRWMCPNHLNHFIDQNLLKSCAATERIKLWDKFAHQRIDQHAVKLQFLKKAHAVNPPFRIKVKHNQKSRVRVPPSVKFHYLNPPDLDLGNMYRSSSFIYPTTAKKKFCTDSSKTDCEILQLQEEKKEERKEEKVEEKMDEKMEEQMEEKTEEKMEEKVDDKMEENVEEMIEEKGDKKVEGKVEEKEDEKKEEKNEAKEENVKIESAHVIIKDNGVILNENDEEKEEKVQNTRTNEIIEDDKCDESDINGFEDNVFIRSGLGLSVKEGISLLERPVLEALAQQRLEQILNPMDECYRNLNCASKARALLFPLGQTNGPPVFMTCRTLNIGTGAESDLLLSRYGLCSCVSSKHAVIFFDEVNKMINSRTKLCPFYFSIL